MGQLVTRTATRAVPRPRRLDLTDRAWKWILLAPAVVVVAGLLVFPILMTFYVSLTDWHLFAYGRPVRFVGLENWFKILADQSFRIPARNTIIFVLGSVPLTYLVGLVVALALNNCRLGRRFFRVFFLLPIMISPVAIAVVIGRMLFNENVGPINDILWRLGLPPVRWLSDPTMAMVSLILIDVWHHSAFMILILTAGVQSLPQEPYEAARVDGATDWQMFRYLTFPLLIPISVTALLIRSLEAFKVVDIVKVVTGGGPGQATESITLAVYDLGVKGGDIAHGAVAAYSLFVIMAVASAALILGTRHWVKKAS
ncbi:MAG: sugar ABC transporter permease [Chloroflexota bacterium]|nr:sugar ABC transporter permease [Chloroflexota bacterium]